MYNANQPKNKCDIVVDEILSMITKGVYKENEKLPPESYFMEYFGMSRVTIRESFKKLSMLGVVDIRQGVGTFVRKIDVSMVMQPLYSAIVMNDLTITQIFDARKYVEVGVAELAARNISEEGISQLRLLTEEMDIVVSRRDRESFTKLDVTFHEKIAAFSGNSIMAGMYQAIKETISKYVSSINLSPGVIERSEQQHREILKALAARDDKQAGFLMGEHVETVKKRYLELANQGQVPAYIK